MVQCELDLFENGQKIESGGFALPFYRTEGKSML